MDRCVRRFCAQMYDMCDWTGRHVFPFHSFCTARAWIWRNLPVLQRPHSRSRRRLTRLLELTDRRGIALTSFLGGLPGRVGWLGFVGATNWLLLFLLRVRGRV